ncbi:MAG: hypothetical protein LBE38_09115 [Deltaproteobacteria bacterium]|jgi:hypothetical protein|nr:hypothetical protein [Deltaproteobacteria bacterium]
MALLPLGLALGRRTMVATTSTIMGIKRVVKNFGIMLPLSGVEKELANLIFFGESIIVEGLKWHKASFITILASRSKTSYKKATTILRERALNYKAEDELK